MNRLYTVVTLVFVDTDNLCYNHGRYSAAALFDGEDRGDAKLMTEYDNKRFFLSINEDRYYPQFLVDKVQDIISALVTDMENGVAKSPEELQARFDMAYEAINSLKQEFEANGSELETVARDSLYTTVEDIIEYFHLPIDADHAARMVFF